MNTETQTIEKPLSLARIYWQQISDPVKGLRISVRLTKDKSLLLQRGTPQSANRCDAFADLVRYQTLGALLLAKEGIQVPPELDTSVFPVLWPADVDDELAHDIDRAREAAAIRCFGTAQYLFSGETMGAALEYAIAHPEDNVPECELKHSAKILPCTGADCEYLFWTHFVALQFNVRVRAKHHLHPLLGMAMELRKRNAPPLLYVIYTPELIFTDLSNKGESDLLATSLCLDVALRDLSSEVDEYKRAVDTRQHAIIFTSSC